MNHVSSGFAVDIARVQPGTKILFACMAGDGHFNPLTGLATCTYT